MNVKTEPDFVEAVSSWEGLPAGTVFMILNGQHHTQRLAVANYALIPEGVEPPEQLPVPQPADLVVGGDVWIGDQAMLLSGCNVSPGCVIGARTLVTSTLETISRLSEERRRWEAIDGQADG